MFVDDPRLAVLIQNEYLRSAIVADGLVRGGHHRGLKHAACIPARGVGGHGDVVCQNIHFDGTSDIRAEACLGRKVLPLLPRCREASRFWARYESMEKERTVVGYPLSLPGCRWHSEVRGT